MSWPDKPGIFEFRLRWDGHDATVHVRLQPPEVKGSIRGRGRDEVVTGRLRGFRAIEDGDRSLLLTAVSKVFSAWESTVGRVVPVPVPAEVLMLLRPPGGIGVQLDLEVPGKGLTLVLRFQEGLPVTGSFTGSTTRPRLDGHDRLREWALRYAEHLDTSRRLPDRGVDDGIPRRGG